jgi:two-component system NarL family sensor kinase
VTEALFAGRALPRARPARPQSGAMQRAVRVTSRVAVVGAAMAAVAGVALAVRDPVSGLDRWLAFTALLYLPVVLVGAAMVGRQPRNPVAWIFLVSGWSVPVSSLLHLVGVFRPEARAALNLGSSLLFVAGVPLAALLGVLLFPDGRLGSRRRRALAGGFVVALVLLVVYSLFSPTVLDGSGVANPLAPPGAWGEAVEALLVVVLLLGPLIGLGAWALLRRAHRTGGDLGAGMRLAAYAGFGCSASFFACLAVGLSGGDTEQIAVLENCGVVVLGVAAWVGIVRYGLFDTRVVVNRALVYGVLTLAVVAVYAGAAGLVGLVAGGFVPQAVATAVAVLAALPLRDVVQRRVNHLSYGLRDEPAAALARLGERLDAAGAPHEALAAAVRTVAEALRMSYVAVEAQGGLSVAYGRRGPEPVRELALPFAGETIGRLVVQSRHSDFGRAEEALLSDLTRQVAAVAHAVALADALRQSRERLVGLREEERRRLRRDLHDGLGPTMAGIALGIDTVRRGLPDGPATRSLAALRAEAEDAVAEVRRIVYDLRPPVLDELGLEGAMREQAARLGGARVEVPEPLPALPAAVEVAAYRIGLEALTNAQRHAPGAPVTVTLSVNGRLRLAVADGGAGIAPGFRAGVGIASMRERAAEVGGGCTVGPGDGGGTLVLAELPLATPGPTAAAAAAAP